MWQSPWSLRCLPKGASRVERPCCGRGFPTRGSYYDVAAPSVLRPLSQPPDHDGGNVGNCDHHCGDHHLIEKSDGRGSRKESCRALFDCVWIECDDMEWSPSPVVAASCGEIYQIYRTAKGKKVEFTGGHGVGRTSLVRMEASCPGRRGSVSIAYGFVTGIQKCQKSLVNQ